MSTLRSFKDRRIGFFAGIKESVQSIAVSGAASAAGIATLIKPYGITVITTTGTGGPHRVMLPRPRAAGVRKTILVNMKTTADCIVVNQTTTDKWFGSTINSALFSTAAGGKGQGNIELVSVSTLQWSVLTPRSATGSANAFKFQNSSN